MALQLHGGSSSRDHRGESTVRLCCLSEDERFLHSLVVSSEGLFIIESRSRPFDNERREELDVPAHIRTELPDHVQESLTIDHPFEIFAIESGSERSPLERSDAPSPVRQDKKFSSICICSRKNVFTVDLGYAASMTPTRDQTICGSALNVREPFQRVLAGDPYAWSNTQIVRVRPAPTYATGYAVLPPPGSLAMLTRNTSTKIYTLTLHHAGISNTTRGVNSITAPLEFAMEDVSHVSGNDRHIVDFCFAASNELALLSSLAVLLIKGNGDVLVASPVLFHGTVVKANHLEETLEYIQEQLVSAEKRSAKWNLCRAAKQYLVDAFSPTAAKNFCTANLFVDAPLSLSFPLQIQGPVLFAYADETGPPALTIECLRNTGIVSVACGMEEGRIDFAVISPTALLPRFAFESKDDSFVLDEAMYLLSCIVERVALDLDTGASLSNTNASLLLLPDPVFDTLLHVCTKTNVSTIKVFSVVQASRQVLHPARTSTTDSNILTIAWPCINGKNLHGAAVSGDDYAGHELIARSANGQLVCVNVSQAQACHELEALSTVPTHSPRLALPMSHEQSASDEALRTLESTPPLHELIAPLLQKLEGGLGKMTKIVGTETASQDITPEQLAVAIQIRETCDQDIVLPLLELKKQTNMRKEKLKMIVASQRQQLSDLAKTISLLQDQATKMKGSLNQTEANATLLSERAATLLQASKDLVPTITQAEYEYFQDLKRIETKCNRAERELNEALTTKSSLKQEPVQVHIEPKDAESAETMLNYCEIALASIRNNLHANEKAIQRVLIQQK